MDTQIPTKTYILLNSNTNKCHICCTINDIAVNIEQSLCQNEDIDNMTVLILQGSHKGSYQTFPAQTILSAAFKGELNQYE